MKMLRARVAVLAFAALGLSVSCGIEDYKYLSPASLVSSTLNSNAVIRLPDGSTVTIDFTNGQIPTLSIPNGMEFNREYEIYYKIYLSDKLMATVNTDTARQDVNPTLDTDWTAMNSYTVDSNNLSSGVASLFTNRKYYAVRVSASGNLMRSDGNGAFSPKPADRLFTTSDDLLDPDYLTSSVNADVAAAKSGVIPSHAYASMYLVMRDFNPQTLNPVYSSLTFTNIFLLPAGASLQNIPVSGATITPISTKPAAVKLKAVITPDNASNKAVAWSVNDADKAGIRTLADNNVIVYSRLAGTSTVTVTAVTEDGGFSALTAVPLSEVAVQSIEISKLSLTLYNNTGVNTETLTVVNVLPQNAYNKSVTWSSSDKNIATVDENTGLVTAKGIGEAVITAVTNDGTELTRSCTVTVQN
ncbi:MAG: Ig-like domain-containing protein [Spirochaetaceae bacterium]|jgi:hypothetical protein|nr:Ig-like domain-containing protein [Spirochaetaceae bacterium]